MAEGAVIRFGRVTNVVDPYGGNRIQVRTEYDNMIEQDEKLPYYIPFMAQFLQVIPKVGELVLVISMAPGEFEQANFYIGPIISQEDKLFYEESYAAMRTTETGYIGWGPNPRTKRDVKPTLYPNTEDICIKGRKNTGVQLKNNEVRVKAGVKVVDDSGPKNNTETPSFISLKYYPDNDYEKDGYKSTATIVADKINLIGTHTKDPATSEIPVTQSKDPDAEDQDNLISDSAMKELINKAHQIPYGDQLIEFLELFRTAFEKHVHPFPTMTPCKDENMNKVTSYKLKGMLSDNVRIN